ncbi:MAG: nickel pincer cofactor biosynthesis protein LarB [Candidatus Scalindua sp. AMX11]|nr:MAG: nickel pincer cofactor biosynthesis protein LarB [Candidatus Scalindua sp.]NOG85136.1 nickel pincer cofactor biosynthesis protein LarB [Planctomycetota bacterium]RZV67658.1 MAG: nickel pincer cofactor biosynthesis protein LarB [Candidatus Scalindua sp. SCAELEC01]TDE63710.1 MAG: nickel pincer cofactor biosynthesis protein LarB [Candidatus Scalindua sp. AMX11]GJQ57209.1 MAG: 1-(5-phosphoribosyl)-5-amino-4-imidazole-carboxyl ate carboxylase [Candidatus Scalindua sp.]
MDENQIKIILRKVKNGVITIDKAVQDFKDFPYKELGFAKVDTHRAIRCGFPEVILCEGKTADQVVKIAEQIVNSGANLLATRANSEIYRGIFAKYKSARYNELAKTIVIKKTKLKKKLGSILIITAGTSDIPVAEEARETAEIMGNNVNLLCDVGVAGIHRLLKNRKDLTDAKVIIVVAGMEGALASVVGGMVDRPVIGVPTSIGYGASFGGVSALLAMLNSCASNVTVVNIDNGFGAAYVASLINRTK